MSKKQYLDLVKFGLYLLPFIYFGALLTSWVEAYYYRGVIFKHTHIDAMIIYLFYGVLGLLGLYGTQWRDNPVLRLFKKITNVGVLVFGIIYGYFYIIHKFNHPNYVFTFYHLHPDLLSVPLALSLYGSLVSSKDILLLIRKNKGTILRWFPILTILTWILFKNITEIAAASYPDLVYIANHPKASYDQKMEYKIGKQFYNYVQFVKNNTPPNSRILIPPFPTSPWPQTGNIPYMTYFLYPRTLLNGEEYSSKYNLNKEEIDYVLVVWGEMDVPIGENTNGWPKFDVKAKKIIYLTVDGHKTEKLGNYIYKDVEGQQLWGIIKVK